MSVARLCCVFQATGGGDCSIRLFTLQTHSKNCTYNHMSNVVNAEEGRVCVYFRCAINGYFTAIR